MTAWGGCSSSIRVELVGRGPEAAGGGCGGEVALGHSEHLEADHEFANLGGAQQRRVEVTVEVHVVVVWIASAAVGGALVEAHGVGEADLKEIVVAGGDGFEDRRECSALCRCQVGEAAEVATGEDEGFE